MESFKAPACFAPVLGNNVRISKNLVEYAFIYLIVKISNNIFCTLFDLAQCDREYISLIEAKRLFTLWMNDFTNPRDKSQLVVNDVVSEILFKSAAKLVQQVF